MGKVGFKLVGLILLCVGPVFNGLAQPVLNIDSTTDPTCADPTGGQIQVSVAGGTDPYTILISRVVPPLPPYSESVLGAPGQSVFVLPDVAHAPLEVGVYAITVVDATFLTDSEAATLSITRLL